ncbi:MAG TPA: LysE family transporter [Saprospiraceae bacterium]|nr:LysE family transporter [Saprospiraceae bacterium]
MLQAIIAGFLLGCGLALITGPIFFALIQTSMSYGRLKAQVLGSGIWFSDVLFAVLLLYFSQYIEKEISWDHPWIRMLSLLGGGVILSVGVHQLAQRFRSYRQKKLELSGKYLFLFSKGFAINTFNPFTLFFWIGLITGSKLGVDYSDSELLALVITLLFTIIVGDNLKIFFAERLGRAIRNRWKERLELFTGLMFLSFGIYLVYLSF